MNIQGILLLGSLCVSLVFTASPHECPRPLGMEKSRIISRQILATSSKDKQHNPDEARLHGPSAWCTHRMVRDKYIQIDLRKVFRIVGIATQGHPTEEVWVKYYAVTYSLNGFDWSTYQEHGEEKIFIGNSDGNTVEYRLISPPIIARVVRVIPIHVASLKEACMRLELYGCKKHLGMFCGDPGTPVLGKREGKDFAVGKKLQYSCDPGYELVGAETLTCMDDGSWDHESPKCSTFTCPTVQAAVQAPTASIRDTPIPPQKEDELPTCKADELKNGMQYFDCRNEDGSRRKLKCEEEKEIEGSGLPASDDEEPEKDDFDLRGRSDPAKEFFFDNN